MVDNRIQKTTLGPSVSSDQIYLAEQHSATEMTHVGLDAQINVFKYKIIFI